MSQSQYSALLIYIKFQGILCLNMTHGITHKGFYLLLFLKLAFVITIISIISH